MRPVASLHSRALRDDGGDEGRRWPQWVNSCWCMAAAVVAGVAASSALFVGTVLLLVGPITPAVSPTPHADGAATAKAREHMLLRMEWLRQQTPPPWVASPPANAGLNGGGIGATSSFFSSSYDASTSVVFFSHIMKTGGTSLSQMLADTFAGEPCLAHAQASKKFSPADRAAIAGWDCDEWRNCTCLFSHDRADVVEKLLLHGAAAHSSSSPSSSSTATFAACEEPPTDAGEHGGGGGVNAAASGAVPSPPSGAAARTRGRRRLLVPITMLRDPVSQRASFFEEKVCHGRHVPTGWDASQQCVWFSDDRDGAAAWVASEYYARTALHMQLRHALPNWDPDADAVADVGVVGAADSGSSSGEIVGGAGRSSNSGGGGGGGGGDGGGGGGNESALLLYQTPAWRERARRALQDAFAWVGVTEEWGESMCVLFDVFRWPYPPAAAGGDGSQPGHRYRARMK
jgi:hypothetical protein